LVIATNSKKVTELANYLESKQYKLILDPVKLFEMLDEPHQLLIDASESQFEKLYEILVQYSTGQVSWYNPKTYKMQFASPHYQDSSLVILVAEQQLAKLEQNNLRIRELCGLTYREETNAS